MPYLGTVELKASDIRRIDITSSTSATHTLTWTAPSEQSLIVTINGVKQQNNYTVSGTTLTLDSALSSSDLLEVIGINDIGTTITPAQGSVDTDQMANDAITSAKIADGAVANADLADMAANTVKVRDANSSGVPSDVALATTEILIGDGTGFTAAALSSDVTMTNAGAVTIANDAVTTAKILDNNVTLAKLDDGTQGDILYYGASGAPTRLGFGTSGDFLKTQGTGANPVWATAGGNNTPAFMVCLNAAQTPSNDTWTKITLNREVLDTDTAFDSSTNYRFTVPAGAGGEYLIYYGIRIGDDASALREASTAVYLNGARLAQSAVNFDNNPARNITMSGTVIITLVATDYLELYGLSNSTDGSPQPTFSGDSTIYDTWMGGHPLIGA